MKICKQRTKCLPGLLQGCVVAGDGAAAVQRLPAGVGGRRGPAVSAVSAPATPVYMLRCLCCALCHDGLCLSTSCVMMAYVYHRLAIHAFVADAWSLGYQIWY